MFRSDPLEFSAKTVEYWARFIGFARRGGFTVSF
jgi:hypothetical protein